VPSEVALACASIRNTTSLSAPDRPPRAARLHFIFALTGLVPLGAFLVAHVALNATALWSTGTFVRATDAVHGVPALGFFEAAFVFAPLVVHAGLGLWLIVARVPLSMPRPYPAAVRVAVRASGVGAAAFLAMHLLEFRFRDHGFRLGGGELATVLAADLSSTVFGIPWRGVVYLLGTGCVAFHFASGLWACVAATRIGDGASARRWTAVSAAGLGAALWLTVLAVVVFHATGVRPFRGAGEETMGPCPAP
jgi:succinate dehydrogenase / fumarate reductase cytochrome b subunit